MRVFLGLAEVSGFYSNLRKGFLAIGVEAELVTLTKHRFQYEDAHPSVWVRLAQYAVAGRVLHLEAALPLRLWWSLLAGVSRLLLLVWAIARFDVFLFCCGTSFFRFRELPLLKFLGKRIIYNFHGTDGRPGFMDGFAENTSMPSHLRAPSGYIGGLAQSDTSELRRQKLEAYHRVTAVRKQNVDIIDRYADVVINSPSHGQHHTRPFVQRSIIGMPYMPDAELLGRPAQPREGDEIVILHSPSYPEGKGSPGIRAAIEAVRAKGFPLRFVEITGKPNREVLELISQCDFVIDQLYSDMPMVGFATEAAFFGKPAIVGGYYARNVKDDLAEEWIPPTLFCMPEEIAAAIEKLASDKDYREALGARARAYVESRWSADISAKRVLQLAQGDFPQDWLYDPAHCHYILGMGMPQEKLRDILAGLLEVHGPDAFCVNDKPAFKKMLVDFATAARI